MDINTDTPSEDINTSTDAAMDTTPSTPASDAPIDAQAPVVEEFTPSYKYKAYGKELEIDEWARPLLNKDTQPHLIKLFERAGGFDHLKQSHKELEGKFGTYESAYSELDGARKKIVSSIDKGDYDTALSMLGIDDQKLMAHVRRKLEYANLPPEQQRAIDEQNQLRQSQELYQRQLMEKDSQVQELMLQKHEFEINTYTANPKYAPLINAYNSRTGNENAFRDVMDRIGAYEFNVNGRNISVPEAMDAAIQMLGLDQGVMNAQPQAMQSQSPMTQKPAPKPIITTSGSSQVPVKKKPMSVADLEQEYQQKYG